MRTILRYVSGGNKPWSSYLLGTRECDVCRPDLNLGLLSASGLATKL